MNRSDLQVFSDYCRAAVENMAYTLCRSSYSTFVKETQDFTIALTDRDGHSVAVPRDLGTTWYSGLYYGRAMRMIDSYEPGDICFTNDPYSGYLSTHAPDIHMWMPIFDGGEIVCFAVGHIHNTDVGGAVPASLSRSLTEVHQEGIRFPPVKIYRAGVLDESLLKVMMTNVRKPDQNWGDLRAFVGALKTGERRVRAILAKVGRENFVQGLADLMDYAEHQARAILSDIPDGQYHFADFIDEDSVGGHPCRIALTLRIRGDHADLDFTGSDPQLSSSLNVPTGGHQQHPLLLVAIYYVLYMFNPGLMLNSGLLRAFTCHTPKGSVVNPVAPAAVGMRSLTCARIRSAIFGAFCQAIPERMPAASAGASTLVNVMTTNERTKQSVLASVNPIAGGGGGGPMRDGVNGSGADSAYLSNSPIEVTEAEVPIRVLQYGLLRDSGGPGRRRGGLATVMRFKVFSPDSRITARNRDRTNFSAWGTQGGKAGSNSNFIINPDSDEAISLGNTDIVIAGPGDVIHIQSAGGGGRGSPLEREVDAVLRDVNRGYVSAAQACDIYGVVVTDGIVDVPQTTAQREKLRKDETAGSFDFGAFRDAFSLTWSDEEYDILTDILQRLPIHWRFFCKKGIFDLRKSKMLAGKEIDVHQAFEKLRSRYPQIPELSLEAVHS